MELKEFKQLVSTRLKKYSRQSYSLRKDRNALRLELLDTIAYDDYKYIEMMANKHTGKYHDSIIDYFEHRQI